MAIAFTMPFSIQLNSLLIVLSFVNFLISGELISRIKAVINNKITLLMLLFFLLYVFSAFMSTNQHEAWAIVERRLSFIAFPILLFNPESSFQLKSIMRAYTAGVILALLICLAVAVDSYFKTGIIAVFFYQRLAATIGMNAVYLSCYSVFAILLLLNESLLNEKYKTLKYFLLAFFIGMCVLLSSKLMLVLLVLVVWVSLYRKQTIGFIQKKVLLFAIVLIGFSVLLIPNVRSRFNTEFTTNFNVVKQNKYNYDTPFTGTSLRLVIWKYSYKIMQESNAWLVGVGTGDFQDELNAKYKASNMYTGNPELHDTGYLGYGPHNQYIETFLSMGIIGFFLFIVLMYRQLFYFYLIKDNTAFVFSILLATFFITESVISTQKGIVFFVFFSVLFLARNCFKSTNIQ